jgi:hypothetical protein
MAGEHKLSHERQEYAIFQELAPIKNLSSLKTGIKSTFSPNFTHLGDVTQHQIGDHCTRENKRNACNGTGFGK